MKPKIEVYFPDNEDYKTKFGNIIKATILAVS